MKPTVRAFDPDQIILQCETNDLNSEGTAGQVARSIIELAFSLKSKGNKISISPIVPINDNLVCVRMLNSSLCAEENIPYIDHTNSIQP